MDATQDIAIATDVTQDVAIVTDATQDVAIVTNITKTLPLQELPLPDPNSNNFVSEFLYENRNNFNILPKIKKSYQCLPDKMLFISNCGIVVIPIY